MNKNLKWMLVEPSPRLRPRFFFFYGEDVKIAVTCLVVVPSAFLQ